MEDATSMPENGGQQANVRIERNSSGKAIHQQISSSPTVDSPGHLLISIEKSDATNGIHQGAAPNTPSTSNSQITPASNNSAGTSNGQSSRPNEDPQSSSLSSTPKTSSSDDNAVHQGATPNIPSEDPKSKCL
ncbi:uncharacterized protein LOC132172402 isoform X1 [Corylus avellana]|uniref:uncharacterized protein LOC132172402 isoform X1 n=1 Tax=Corylus avellana TaxID=13451 RepID=UPI00286B54F2|nr:uncharacterized protein LOC132172402 isoform X1 [Corylus avellana]XP_059439873.1 uncharacterized protein LOC132172402 isoform X1 [Corylus avellana]XP_059439874.1 uncharacterized protein LOC132172402 isoform X1 [Corylus avellana]XP_059439875.1 uncharacterized protein LOC132172402 isoform X1 [Corylus avellana]XP_059439876.1 uncharacterized protein LOC132172402 isoform X1 [Corylus avellana]XP_059439877.1 uncharacterized protein LOC132172402 isoform X1 [Corylus avellana]